MMLLFSPPISTRPMLRA